MAGATGPRGPYAKTAQVRQRIIEACIDEFGSVGYHATTMKDVAARTGLSQKGLAHHFPSKDELLAAVLEYSDTLIADTIRPDGALDAVLGMLDLVLKGQQRPGMIEMKAILSAEAVAPQHPAHRYFKDRYEAYRTYLTAAFTELAAAGQLRSDLPPRTLAIRFIALIDGLQIQSLYDPDAVDTEAVLREFLRSVLPAPDASP